ncbi:MAG: beta-lactamase [Flaviaesturariibacter sp.]|nr:beta-lactamase [Flaviaesturariibacter sp.]
MKYGVFLFLAITLLAGCSPNNVNKDESLGKYFKEAGVEGCFALLNNASGEFTMYNLERYRDSAYLPASTFKIVNSLIGLQTGKIVNDSMVIRWDGIDRGRTECNKDLSMYDAFRLSCPPWYQELARRIGKDTMKRWIDSLSYGNMKISKVDTFWLDNSLKIRADEQLGLVKRLYFNQLPFYKLNQEIVKKAMLFEDTPNYKLSYKTGWGQRENGNQLAWIVGWIEENRHPYFFVLNFETPNKNADIPGIRMKMLKGMLKQLGFMEGRM